MMDPKKGRLDPSWLGMRSPGGFRSALAVTGVAGWLLLLTPPLGAQERTRQWERREEATAPPVTVFHSTQAINLPTAETLARGEWQFEIAHRFFPPFSDGADALWGLDGPANMRLGLGYAPHDRLLVTLGRSNLGDNLDLRFKLRVMESRLGSLPLMAALQAGGAWSDVPQSDSGGGDNGQAYAQLILNTLVGHRLALGVVPSFLHNALPDSTETVQVYSLGLHGQWYATGGFSAVAEWNLGNGGGELNHDAGSFGIEMETGGHFFKVFVTNSIRLNPSQFLAGTDFPFEAEEWRLGFAITRLLRF